MLYKLVPLALAGLAAASPLTRRSPPTSTSNGFTLVVNVTDPTRDLSPSIQGWRLEGAHVGAGMSAAVLNGTTAGRIFYENGTAAQVGEQSASILTDGGTPPAPYGLQIYGTNVTISVGAGSPGLVLSDESAPTSTHLTAEGGVFAACPGTLPYYGPDWHFVLLIFVEEAIVDGPAASPVPAGCAPINLVPQCAVLPELPDGSYASHAFASTVSCYDDVGCVNWNS